MAQNEQLTRFIGEIKYREKINQAKIAEQVGIDAHYLSDVKNGRYPLTEEIIGKFYGRYPYLKNLDGNVATVVGDGTAVAGNSNHVEVPTIISKALDEISAQRMLTQKAQEQLDKAYDQVSKAQEQIDRLITLLEKQHQ